MNDNIDYLCQTLFPKSYHNNSSESSVGHFQNGPKWSNKKLKKKNVPRYLLNTSGNLIHCNMIKARWQRKTTIIARRQGKQK